MGVKFTMDSARRIARATRAVEKMGGGEYAVDYFNDSLEKMFEVFSSSPLEIGVRAGLSIRWVGGVQYSTSTTITTDGLGPTMDPFYVEYLAATSSGYVIGTLDDPNTPTQFTLSFSAGALPTTTDATVLVIAYVSVVAGAINQIIQMHEGLWEIAIGSGTTNVDNHSIEIDTGYTPDKIAIFDFDYGNPTTYDPTESGFEYAIPYADGVGTPGAPTDLHWMSRVNLADNLVAYWIGTPPDPAPWKEADWVPKHEDLDFTPTTSPIVGNSGGNPNHDDHLWVKGAGVTNDANTCNYGTAIGRAVNDLAINLTDSQLCDASADVTLNWNGMLLQNAGSTRVNWSTGAWYTDGTIISGNWINRELNSSVTAGTWTVKHADSHFVIEGTEPATFGTLATGALQVAGGASFGAATQIKSSVTPHAAYFLDDVTATVAIFSNAPPLHPTSGDFISLIDNGRSVVADFRKALSGVALSNVQLIDTASGASGFVARFTEDSSGGTKGLVDVLGPTYGLNVMARGGGSGLINADVGYYCNDVAGMSESTGDYCLVHKTTGALLPVKVYGGILCAI